MSEVIKQHTFKRIVDATGRMTYVRSKNDKYYLVSSILTEGHGLETMIFSCEPDPNDQGCFLVDWHELWSKHYTDYTVMRWHHQRIVEHFDDFEEAYLSEEG